jgi:uncharacterized protein (TIGR02246 family)
LSLIVNVTIKTNKVKIFFLLCLASFLSIVSMGQSSKDSQLVREVVKSFVNDYNNGDFKNASFYTTNDWVHINPGGGITRGRAEVLKEVRAIHQTMLKGIKITIETMTIRFVATDVAVINAIHKSDTYITPEDGIKHEHERQMKTYIIVRQKGKWLLTLDQNTIISNP